MSHSAMEENSTKQTDFQKQLDMRNDKISELQKEIMWAEQDKETSGVHLDNSTFQVLLFKRKPRVVNHEREREQCRRSSESGLQSLPKLSGDDQITSEAFG